MLFSTLGFSIISGGYNEDRQPFCMRQALIDLRLFYDLNLHSEAICLSVEVPNDSPEHKGGNIDGILGKTAIQ